MNIAILLPYKENYSKYKAGAVSIFVNHTTKLSKFKKNTKIYGSTTNKDVFLNYKNIDLSKRIFQSNTIQYLNKFANLIKYKKIDIIEIHNRPHYLQYLQDFKCKKVLFFHNDPLNMQGSTTVKERINLLNVTDKIIFNSSWSKSRFLSELPLSTFADKIQIINQSTSKVKIDFKQKKKIISFIGKLNSSKGYDVFGKAIIKILNKYKNWKAIVIGDEPREKLIFNHKNLIHYGYKDNSFILNKLKQVSISTVPSKWDEPFGRSSLEAASRGCAVITSNTGGLSETTNCSITLNKVTEIELYKKIEYLIENVKFRNTLQKNTYYDFKLTNQLVTKKIDNLRSSLITKKINILKYKKNKLKILHITNFNERFDGRLHYNTGKRINNGLIRNGHNVLNISDRDIISNYRSLNDPSGIKVLNKKIIANFENFNPDLVLLGHSDNVSIETLDFIKNKKKSLKISQWFLDPVSKYGPDYTKNKKRFLKFQKHTDANFITTDPSAIDFKIKNTYFIPNPADEAFETLDNYKADCENDVFFAMSHGVHRGILKKNKRDNREHFLKKLMKNRNIKADFYGFENKQPIWGDSFKVQLSKSKMGLNLSRGKPIKYYSSDRLAQLMGNGLLTFIDEKTCYSDFFNKKEIVTYKNVGDLTDKILKFKKDNKSRKLIARNGKKKYMSIFNSKNVADYIVCKTCEIKKTFCW